MTSSNKDVLQTLIHECAVN